MCSQFVMVPKEVVEDIIRDIEMKRVPRTAPEWSAQRQSAFPRSQVPVIVPEDGELKAKEKVWGYEMSWNKNVVFNTRFETATRPGHSMWTESLRQRRCIVPTFGFFEPHQSETFINPRSGRENKQKYFFSRSSTPVLFVAGVFEEDRFSLMTTEPNDIMRPIHDRMPVVLELGELETWLFGDYLSLADRSAIDLITTKATA